MMLAFGGFGDMGGQRRWRRFRSLARSRLGALSGKADFSGPATARAMVSGRPRAGRCASARRDRPEGQHPVLPSTRRRDERNKRAEGRGRASPGVTPGGGEVHLGERGGDEIARVEIALLRARLAVTGRSAPIGDDRARGAAAVPAPSAGAAASSSNDPSASLQATPQDFQQPGGAGTSGRAPHRPAGLPALQPADLGDRTDEGDDPPAAHHGTRRCDRARRSPKRLGAGERSCASMVEGTLSETCSSGRMPEDLHEPRIGDGGVALAPASRR